MSKTSLANLTKRFGALIAVCTAFAMSSCAPSSESSASRASVTIQLGSRGSNSSFSASASWTSSAFTETDDVEAGPQLLEPGEDVKLWAGSSEFLLDDISGTLIVPSMVDDLGSGPERVPLDASLPVSQYGTKDVTSFCYVAHVASPADAIWHPIRGLAPHDMGGTGEIFGPVKFGESLTIEADAGAEIDVQLLGFSDPDPRFPCQGDVSLVQTSEAASVHGRSVYARPHIQYNLTVTTGSSNFTTNYFLGRRARLNFSGYFGSLYNFTLHAIRSAFRDNQQKYANLASYVFFKSDDLVSLEADQVNEVTLTPTEWTDDALGEYLTPPLWGAEEEVLMKVLADPNGEVDYEIGHGIPMRRSEVSAWYGHPLSGQGVNWKKIPPTHVDDFEDHYNLDLAFECPNHVQSMEVFIISYSGDATGDPAAPELHYIDTGTWSCVFISPSQRSSAEESLAWSRRAFFPKRNQSWPDQSVPDLADGDFVIYLAIPIDNESDAAFEPGINMHLNGLGLERGAPYFNQMGIRLWKFQQDSGV